MPHSEEKDIAEEASAPLRLGDWLWRPCYAKLWWAAVPLYWLGMIAASRSPGLAIFYQSALAGYTTVFFLPPMVALILSYGFWRAWLSALSEGQGVESKTCDVTWVTDDRWRLGPSGLPAEVDPLDPRSGAIWIGNPANPYGPNYLRSVSES